MKEYSVTIPIAGSITVIVKAQDKDEAKNIALSDWPFKSDTTRFECEPKDVVVDAWLNELETYEKIAEGNVLYVPFNEVEVDEVEEEE